MSYLRGPMSREQIRQLDAADGRVGRPARLPRRRPTPAAGPPGLHGRRARRGRSSDPAAWRLAARLAARTSSSTSFPGAASPPRTRRSSSAPRGSPSRDAKLGIAGDARRALRGADRRTAPCRSTGRRRAGSTSPPRTCGEQPAPDAPFDAISAGSQQPKNYAAWQKTFAQWLAQYQRARAAAASSATKLTSTRRRASVTFAARVQDARRAGARRGGRSGPRANSRPNARRWSRRAAQGRSRDERKQQQASEQKTQTMLSVGAAALGAMFGKKALSSGNARPRDDRGARHGPQHEGGRGRQARAAKAWRPLRQQLRRSTT